jgi:hypothetical protein
MLNPIEISAAEQLANDLLAFTNDDVAGKRADALARLRSRAAKMRGNLQKKDDELTRLYFKAIRETHSPDEIETAAKIVADYERALAERLLPRIGLLQQKLTVDQKTEPEVQSAIDLALAWLGLYGVHREALSKLAAERRGIPPDVLKARPVNHVEYGELIREHMARYPKIRAALAK